MLHHVLKVMLIKKNNKWWWSTTLECWLISVCALETAWLCARQECWVIRRLGLRGRWSEHNTTCTLQVNEEQRKRRWQEPLGSSRVINLERPDHGNFCTLQRRCSNTACLHAALQQRERENRCERKNVFSHRTEFRSELALLVGLERERRETCREH